MSLCNVHVVNAFTRQILCDQVLVGYEDRKIYLPKTCSSCVGHVVKLKHCMESIRYPIQVHSEYDAFVNLFTDSTALQEGVLNETDCDYDYILSCSFFILTEGVGIMVDENSPRFIPYEIDENNIASLSVFHTGEGIVPHTLIVPANHDLDIKTILQRIISKEVRNPDAFKIHEILDRKDDEICVYIFMVPCVIPFD